MSTPNPETELFKTVRKLVADKLSVTLEEVNIDSTFAEDLGADSLDIVELVMALEEEFDIEIPDEAAEGIATVGAALEYIEQVKASA